MCVLPVCSNTVCWLSTRSNVRVLQHRQVTHSPSWPALRPQVCSAVHCCSSQQRSTALWWHSEGQGCQHSVVVSIQCPGKCWCFCQAALLDTLLLSTSCLGITYFYSLKKSFTSVSFHGDITGQLICCQGVRDSLLCSFLAREMGPVTNFHSERLCSFESVLKLWNCQVFWFVYLTGSRCWTM